MNKQIAEEESKIANLNKYLKSENGKEIKIIFRRHVMNCRKNIYQDMVDIVIIFLS